MKLNCSLNEIKKYTDSFGGPQSVIGHAVIMMWAGYQSRKNLPPRDFDLEIIIKNDIDGFKQISFEPTKRISNTDQLMHYLLAYDNYMLTKFSDKYESIFCENPNWFLLAELYRKMVSYNFDPITVIVTDKAIETRITKLECSSPYYTYQYIYKGI